MNGSQLVGIIQLVAGTAQRVYLDTTRDVLGLTLVSTYQYEGTKTGSPVFKDGTEHIIVGDEMTGYLPVNIKANMSDILIQMMEPGTQAGVYQDETPSAEKTDAVAVMHFNGPFIMKGYTNKPYVEVGLKAATAFGAGVTALKATVEVFAVYGETDVGRYFTTFNDPNSLQIHKADAFGPSNSKLTRILVVPGTTTTYVDSLEMTPYGGARPVALARKNGPRALYSVWADAALSNRALVERIDVPRYNGQSLQIELSTADSVIAFMEAQVPALRTQVASKKK